MFETPESKWRALQMRNPLAASAFLYGVTTTRIYCRPTCPSRLARQANVVFFDSATDAEGADFRACKRCKPSQTDFKPNQAQHKKAVRKACELMDAAGGRLTLESLANSVGLSPRYFHGVFKGVMGVTPSVYAMSVRKGKERHAAPRNEGSKNLCLDDRGTQLPRNEDNESTVSEVKLGSPSTGVRPHDIFPAPEDASSDQASTACLESSYCGSITNTFSGTILFPSDSVLGGIPDDLDDNEALTLLFGYPGLHGMESTADHGVALPWATQLPITDDEYFSFFSDVPDNCYSGWII